MSTPARTAGVHCRFALLDSGWARNVRIQHVAGRIRSIEAEAPPAPGDETAFVLLPGLPNVHSHGFQRGMAGLTERRQGHADSFWSWRELMYRFVARLTPEDLQALTAQAFVEMLEAGFTRVGEFHYVHHDADGEPFADLAEMSTRIAAAAEETGIGLTLLPVFYAHGGFAAAPAAPEQARFLNDVDRYARLLEASRRAVAPLEGAVVGIAPHSLRAVTHDELSHVVKLCERGPIHIHIAEQLREVQESERVLGARPVDWLMDHTTVDSRWCLVHATHLSDGERERVARSGAVAGLCPITEANLGDGAFRLDEYAALGGAWAIGSDSNVLISASEELRWLEYGQRLRLHARNVLSDASRSTGRMLFDHAFRGGSQALGAPDGRGLAIGAAADFFTLKDDLVFEGRQDDELLDTFIFAEPRPLVDRVWRAGRKVVSGGVHVARDRIAAGYRSSMKRLLGA